MSKPLPQQREPDQVLGEAHARGVLEELHGFCANMNAECSRGGKPDGAVALAKVMQHIRVMQARESLRALDGRNPLDVPPPGRVA